MKIGAGTLQGKKKAMQKAQGAVRGETWAHLLEEQQEGLRGWNRVGGMVDANRIAQREAW